MDLHNAIILKRNPTFLYLSMYRDMPVINTCCVNRRSKETIADHHQSDSN